MLSEDFYCECNQQRFYCILLGNDQLLSDLSNLVHQIIEERFLIFSKSFELKLLNLEMKYHITY